MKKLTKEDCIKFDKALFLGEGIAVLDVDAALKDEYKDPKYQLVTCGGFAANPNTIAAARGSGVFVDWVIDDDHSRYERYYIIGIAKPEVVKQWLDEYRDNIGCPYLPEYKDEAIKMLEEYTQLTEQELINIQLKHYEDENKEESNNA